MNFTKLGSVLLSVTTFIASLTVPSPPLEISLPKVASLKKLPVVLPIPPNPLPEAALPIAPDRKPPEESKSGVVSFNFVSLPPITSKVVHPRAYCTPATCAFDIVTENENAEAARSNLSRLDFMVCG